MVVWVHVGSKNVARFSLLKISSPIWNIRVEDRTCYIHLERLDVSTISFPLSPCISSAGRWLDEGPAEFLTLHGAVWKIAYPFKKQFNKFVYYQ